MELTLDQVLQKGIEAHRTGQIQEADRLYTVILKAQPDHPDANHNMGVLAVGVDKIQEALPFFKTALEVNPKVSQYWLSYIDALIKLDRIADAIAVFDQAKDRGANDEPFEQMGKLLSEIGGNLKDPPLEKLQSIVNLYAQGQLQEALSLATGMMDKFPNSAVLYNIVGASNAGLMQFDAAIDSYKLALKVKPDYADAYNNLGIALNSQGDPGAAIISYAQAVSIKPDYADAYNNMGIALNNQGDPEAAIGSYNKAVSIQPDFAEAYYNMGNILKDRGDPEAAIDCYNKALKIKPDYAEAYNNKGIALKSTGDLEAAVVSYRQALKIKSDSLEVYNNMGNALQYKGDPHAAIDSYKQALKIKPDYAEAFVNLNGIEVQLSDLHLHTASLHFNDSESPKEPTAQNLRFQIYQSISNFMAGDIDSSKKNLIIYNRLTKKTKTVVLTHEEKAFCSGYFNFIDSLTKDISIDVQFMGPFIYHIGESHCLSYAHSTILKKNNPHNISPRITFGAKAFHFSDHKNNIFKAVTSSNLGRIPKQSTVFISIGEIDCRAGEGIIPASKKNGSSLEKTVRKTVEGFVSWFLSENIVNQHLYYFFNVPAPVYKTNQSQYINSKVADVVFQFNFALHKKLLSVNAHMIDVYKHTEGAEGFSNGLYHCDGHHLDTRIIDLIQDQLKT